MHCFEVSCSLSLSLSHSSLIAGHSEEIRRNAQSQVSSFRSHALHTHPSSKDLEKSKRQRVKSTVAKNTA